MGECQYAIDSLPAYTPQLIAFLIALLEFIIVAIAYIGREAQRKKTFYGREDFEDIPEEEKMEQEGAIMGKNIDELHILQSADRTAEVEVGSETTPSTRGVKVMVRRKKAISQGTGTFTKEVTPTNAKVIRFTLEIDSTGRGFEFITLLQKALQEVGEFKHISFKLTDSTQNRLCDFLIRKMRTILEESTQRRWLVHGVIQNKIWQVNGLENLLEKGGDIRTQQMLRITAQGPIIPITILAYMIEIDPKLEQMKTPSTTTPFNMSRMSKIYDESATQTISRTFEKTPHTKPKFSPVIPADVTNYPTTMSTLPSEKLPTATDTFIRSLSSSKNTRRSSISLKQKKTSTSHNRKSSIGKIWKFSTINKQKTSTDTDPRSKFRSHHSNEKLSTERTQSEQ
ncbi:Protein fmp-52 [Dirofilaria immitis]